MPADDDLQKLCVQVARLETILTEVIVPQSEASNVRLVAIDEACQLGISTIKKRIKKIERDLILYKYTFSSVIAIIIFLYSKIIIIDSDLITKYLSIFSVIM